MRFKPLTDLQYYHSQYILIRYINHVSDRLCYRQYWFNSDAKLLVKDDEDKDSIELAQFLESMPGAEFATV